MSVGEVRILHIIDTLGGGGSQRLLTDIVRLSPPDLTRHLVFTVSREDVERDVYADELAARGVYERSPHASPKPAVSLVGVARRRKHRIPRPIHRILFFGWHGVAIVSALIRLRRVLQRYNPDVIHTHVFPDPFIIGALLRMATRVPVIHTMSCLFSQMVGDGMGWMPSVYGRLHPWVDRFSTSEAIELTSKGVPSEKILDDCGGVDLEWTDSARAVQDVSRARIRNSLGIDEGCCLILSVGRLHPYKGHHMAIASLPHVIRQLGDAHLVILGQGPEEERLRLAAGAASVVDRVHFMGFHRDPLPFYSAADVYVRAALYEPENLSFYLASAMGLPIVGVETGWSTDPLRRRGHGIVVPINDASAMASAMAFIFLSPDRARAMGAAGIAYAHQSLDIRTSVAKLVSTYQALASPAHRVSIP